MRVSSILRGEHIPFANLGRPKVFASVFIPALASYFVLMMFMDDVPFHARYLSIAFFDFAKAFMYLMFAIACARFYREKKILGWRIAGIGASLWVPSQTLLGILALVEQDPFISATVIDPIILLVVLFAISGFTMVGFHGLATRERVRLVINAVSFGSCISFIGIVYISQYILRTDVLNINSEILNMLYFAIDVMLISLAMAVILFRGFDRVYLPIGLAMILLAAADIAYLITHFGSGESLPATRTIQSMALVLLFYASTKRSGIPIKVPTVQGETFMTLGVNVTVLGTIFFALIKFPAFDPIPDAVLFSFVAMFITVLLAHMVGYFENKKLISAREKSIKEISESEEKYQDLATHDTLTHLCNRTYFIEELTRAFVVSKEIEFDLAIFFIDLDRFKEINDTHGHSIGDQVIKEVANRITDVVGDKGLVARLGGDEFSVLIPAPAQRDFAFDIATKILEATIEPLNVSGSESYLSCSIGIAFSGGENDNPQSILRNADIAMYRAKETGRNRIEYADEVMHVAPENSGWSLSDLRKAIVENEIKVFFQPIYDLQTNKLFAFEALARWDHPEYGIITPDEFITVAEDNGLIIDMGSLIFDQSFSQLGKWQLQQKKLGEELLLLNVNLSFRQLNDALLLEHLLDKCRTYNIDPRTVNIEMTESSLLGDVRSATTILKEISQHGFNLHIDDFGTGYSSLSYLKKFPVSGFKIDKSFVKGYGSNEDDTAIVTAMIALGKSMGLLTTAEGIQTKAIRDELLKLGCTYGQGYFYSKPKAPEEIVFPRASSNTQTSITTAEAS